MTKFTSVLARDLTTFLEFKRGRGYRYDRAEYMLRSFDRFIAKTVARRRAMDLGNAILSWLGSRPPRKPISVAMDLSVLREFWRYVRRRDPTRCIREPNWPQLPHEPDFVARVLSPVEVRLLLRLVARLERPRFRRDLYRSVFLVLYCTGLRFGEALRLRVRDVDLRRGVIFVSDFKNRSRWVPLHISLTRELRRYFAARRRFVGLAEQADDPVFVGANRRRLSISAAQWTLRKLFRSAELKPARGRVGPRPYDLRHTFAVHRLTRWYRQRVDLHARLPWLSAYLGHVDLLGTETYLNATPELLELAGDRFRTRYRNPKRAK
jgi:integrase/recombinase XerD